MDWEKNKNVGDYVMNQLIKNNDLFPQRILSKRIQLGGERINADQEK